MTTVTTGPTYSLAGYLQALAMRSRRVLLVEGPTDHAILKRVVFALEERHADLSNRIVVDTADEVRDPDLLSGLGARQRVERVHSEAKKAAVPLLAFVDREYRGFSIVGPSVEDLLQCHEVVDETLFWSRGHSIENYFMDAAFFCAMLVFRFSREVPPETLRVVRNEWEGLVRETACLSLALFGCGQLARCGGCAHLKHWKRGPNGLRLDLGEVRQSLVNRGASATDGEMVLKAVEELRGSSALSTSELPRWLCHGHVGMEFLWAATSRIAEEHGAAEACQVDLCGHAKEKLHYAADWWARMILVGQPGVASPDALWAKLVG